MPVPSNLPTCRRHRHTPRARRAGQARRRPRRLSGAGTGGAQPFRLLLLLGGRGHIGAGLHTYLSHLDPGYRITSVDLPGAPDRAPDANAQRHFVDLDINEHPGRLVEQWCEKMAARGHAAVAARWGGINAANEVNVPEKGYFALWCHQQDAARFVHACYRTHCDGGLRSDAHYFVVSNNTYNLFDLELPRRVIGYEPQYDAEIFYQG